MSIMIDNMQADLHDDEIAAALFRAVRQQRATLDGVTGAVAEAHALLETHRRYRDDYMHTLALLESYLMNKHQVQTNTGPVAAISSALGLPEGERLHV